MGLSLQGILNEMGEEKSYQSEESKTMMAFRTANITLSEFGITEGKQSHYYILGESRHTNKASNKGVARMLDDN